MNVFKTNKVIIIFIFISIIATILVYASLPDKIPFHWNIQGEIDAWANKSFSWFTAILPLGIYLLMTYLPAMDPRRDSYLKHKKAYGIFMTLLVFFFILLHWIIVLTGLGYHISVSRIVPMGIGALFIVIGNYLGQIRPNYSTGIKTPWTLADETVWKKTHRVGGLAFILSGIIFIIIGIVNQPVGFILAICTIFLVVIYVCVYSYIEYKKLKN